MLIRASLIGTLLVVCVVVHGASLVALAPDAYNRSVQEDEYLEWASFWAFAIAGFFWLTSAIRQRPLALRDVWFPAGLGLFCLFVAMEEISWGQRIFAYRAPRYFLENNFQLELNIHNLVETSWRKRALYGVIAGYGVVLPLACLLQRVREGLNGLGISAPALSHVPAFAITLGLYLWYPWSHTGESVELMLGLGFLFASIDGALVPSVSPTPSGWRLPRWYVVGFVCIGIAGLASAALSRVQRSSEPGNVTAAERETMALSEDFLALEPEGDTEFATRCGLHKRVHSYVEKYGKEELREGRFAGLIAQGMPEDRADFMLDPWNSPYWIRHWCDKDTGAEVVYVYSFGPDRMRDSSRNELLGDDVGRYLVRKVQ